MNSPREPLIVLESIPSISTALGSIELNNILKAIGEGYAWRKIFEKHCDRTGKSSVSPDKIDISTRKNNYTTVAVIWQGKQYKSACWSVGSALDCLYEDLVRSVIKEELKQQGK